MTIDYVVDAFPSDVELNGLMRRAWDWRADEPDRTYADILSRSLTHICAFCDARLVGFVNVAWDGGLHAFILDTSVHPDFRRQSIGIRLVREAASVAGASGALWLHVDYTPHLRDFYARCGFTPTQAGLLDLSRRER